MRLGSEPLGLDPPTLDWITPPPVAANPPVPSIIMRKSFTVLFLAAWLASGGLSASVLFQDSFTAGAVGDPIVGYTHTTTSNPPGTIAVTAPGLTFAGLGESAGNAALATMQTTRAIATLSSSIPVSTAGNSGVDSFYLGFLMNLPAAGSWGSALSGVQLFYSVEGVTREGFNVGLRRQSSADQFSVGLAGRASANIGATNTLGNQVVFTTGKTATPGTTYFVLTKFTINYDSNTLEDDPLMAQIKIFEGGVDTFSNAADPVWDATFFANRGHPVNNAAFVIDSIGVYADNVSYRPAIDEIWVTKNIEAIGIPEPGTYALMAGFLVLVVGFLRRRRC